MKPDSAPKNTRKKHEPVDARLVGTAGRCFIEDGFGIGIDDILAESNVAKRSLYLKFQSKYGLIERLLEDAATEWKIEIDKVAADQSLQGAEKVLRLLKSLCTLSRDVTRRTGLMGQALIEFPRTGKQDETHKKKDQVHEKARRLQRELLKSVEKFCGEAGVKNPAGMAQQVLLLANGYLVSEPLFGKVAALKITTETAGVLIRVAMSFPADDGEKGTDSDETHSQRSLPSVRSEAKVRPVGPWAETRAYLKGESSQ